MPGISRSTIAGKNRKSKLHIEKKGNKGYDYTFDDMEFIIENAQDVIHFELQPVRHSGHSKPAHESIVDYCTTKSATGKVVPIDPANPTVSLTTPFPQGTTKVSFRVELDPHEMILIGLIVAIEEDGEVVHMICDPQVGNGPPAPLDPIVSSKYRPAFIIETE